MNSLIGALILALVQGITEWIPVSSSGHLVLFEHFLGYEADILFDVSLHFGTLMAVFVYFGRDITDILQDIIKGKFKSQNGKTGVLLIIATIPAAFLGFILRNVFESAFNSLGIVAMGFGITGLFLFIASLEKRAKEKKNDYLKSSLIGAAQAVSILPGISRSGATISSGILLGLGEKEAVRFSFLMSIPIIFGATVLEVGSRTLPSELIWATLVSFITGLIAIHILYKFILTSRKNLRWFGIYALLLSAGIGIYLLFI